ncbi:MAG: hypothetical protein JNM57_02700 [Cyclobacteriaceae bacterium]|nr:hypothetical protein [Cyclobacteriaceae bacterium]
MKNLESRLLRYSKCILVTLFALASGCGTSDLEPQNVVVYTIDGEDQHVTFVSAIFSSFDIWVPYNVIEIDFNNNTSSQLELNVFNFEFQEPPNEGLLTGSYFNLDPEGTGSNGKPLCRDDPEYGEVCAEVDAWLRYKSKGSFWLIENDSRNSFNITQCNTKMHSISGDFDMVLANSLNEELAVKGTFKNVQYTVWR